MRRRRRSEKKEQEEEEVLFGLNSRSSLGSIGVPGEGWNFDESWSESILGEK